GWKIIRAKAGVSEVEAAEYARGDNIPLLLLGWVMGCSMIWSALFTVGNFLYGRMEYAWALLAVFVVSAGVLIRVVQRLWN
ncbi:MAG TPA: Na+:solute symporter, partial [Bryobacteraceae bacterium]